MGSRFNSYLSLRMIADRFVAGLMMVLLSPLFAIVSLVILCRMGRPLLFRQQRIGQFGATFEIVKFRTMIEDAETIGGGYMAPELDLIPPLGRFLRASSLDELPQLINIFRGEMSFVGPRPALPQQFARYSPKQARRVLVPQGITGLAQVTYRNEATWSQRIEKDLEYIESIGFVTDMKLLVLTVYKVLRSEGVVTHQTAGDVDDLGQNN
jgi:lipopolysaccharide/colanic/teichoic acid biosynthesis glycosyltransferase